MPLVYIFLTIFILGCNKPDPNPELKDGIWLDMQAQLQITQKNIADFQKQAEEHKADLAKVKPQTGQIKYAEKRYWQTKNHIDLLLQQEAYWKIRMDERAKFAKKEYLRAFKDGKPWPDPNEISEYMAEKRLRQAKQQWNVKSRIEEAKKDLPQAPPEKPTE